MSKAITPASIETFTKQPRTAYTAAQRAVTVNGIYAASENNFLSATNSTVFSSELTTGAVSNQEKSGRCWLFSTVNVLRHQIEATHNIESFELSQSYLYFWDKLEKSNTFYEQMIALAKTPLEDRLVEALLKDPQGDGGWWEYSVALITKYGIVPKSVMPEASATSNSAQLNTLLNRMLRKGAFQLRELAANDASEAKIQATKQALLGDVYHYLTIAIGTPPQSFNFSYRDKKKKFHRQDTLTPLEFLATYTKNNLSDYVSLLNDPSPSKKYNKTYRFAYGGNMVGGVEPLFLNTDMATIKKLTMQQLKAGEAVWFGCDVTQYTNKKGFMALDVYDFTGTFGVDFSLTKADRLASRDSSVNHAMTITGVDIVGSTPKQWKVENSWGEESGQKGYYTMSSDWFDEYGYIAVIRRDLLPPKLQQALEQPAEVIPIWDPISAPYPASL